MLNFRPGRIGGTETYLRQLASHAVEAAGGDTVILVLTRDNEGQFPRHGEQRVVVDRSDTRLLAARMLEAFTAYRARFAERALAEADADVVLFPQQSIFPKRVSCACVVTVHDLLHLYMPRCISPLDRAFRRGIYPYSLQRADHVIANSAFTRKTLIERCGLPGQDITVTLQGLTRIETASIRPSDKVQGPYLYYPAATFPHKGHDILLKTFATLRRREGFNYKLVLTGQKTPHWKTLGNLIHRLGIDSDVTHLGFIPRQEVFELFQGASAVVFPTRFEGFGRPVWEAAQFKKKVIVSRLEVFEEIGVPGQFRIDFADPDQLLSALAADGPTELKFQPWTARQMVDVTFDVLRAAARAKQAPDPLR